MNGKSLQSCVRFFRQYNMRYCCSKRMLTPENLKLAEGVLSGDRSALARSITLIESTRRDHQDQSEYMLDYLGKNATNKRTFQNNRTFRIGIAGSPGAGTHSYINIRSIFNHVHREK